MRWHGTYTVVRHHHPTITAITNQGTASDPLECMRKRYRKDEREKGATKGNGGESEHQVPLLIRVDPITALYSNVPLLA